jgi:large conductance mechanosensitive channel
MSGFLDFIRKQGVIGLAVGFLLGGAVSKVVTALVTDIINPLLGVIFGVTDGLKDAKFERGSVAILWGDFVAVSIDFLVIAAVVYYGVRILGIETPEKKSDKKK